MGVKRFWLMTLVFGILQRKNTSVWKITILATHKGDCHISMHIHHLTLHSDQHRKIMQIWSMAFGQIDWFEPCSSYWFLYITNILKNIYIFSTYREWMWSLICCSRAVSFRGAGKKKWKMVEKEDIFNIKSGLLKQSIAEKYYSLGKESCVHLR